MRAASPQLTRKERISIESWALQDMTRRNDMAPVDPSAGARRGPVLCSGIRSPIPSTIQQSSPENALAANPVQSRESTWATIAGVFASNATETAHGACSAENKGAMNSAGKQSSVLLFVDLELKGMLLNQYDAILEHELFKDAECVRACAPHSDDVSLLLCYAHSDFHNVFIERSFSGTVMQVLCLMLISCNPFVPH
jgi:hypothetical protein